MLDSIISNVFFNLEAPIVFLVVAMALRLANIVLGSIDAIFKKEFDWGKFFSGIWKMLVVAVTILLVVIVLNLFSYGLTLIDIIIPKETVNAMTVILIIVTWCLDLAQEVAEKIKAQKTLKYVSYDDVLSQENPQTEKGIC